MPFDEVLQILNGRMNQKNFFQTENGEMVVAIQPDLCRAPSRRFGQCREDVEIIFARTFGVNGACQPQMRRSRRGQDAVPRRASRLTRCISMAELAGVPTRFMCELVERKVAVELPVDPRQKVEVEGRRHALWVVIGVDLLIRTSLLRSTPTIALPSLADMTPEPAQEGGGLGLIQVADGRTRKEGDPVPGWKIGQLEIMVEVGDDRKNVEVGKTPFDRPDRARRKSPAMSIGT